MDLNLFDRAGSPVPPIVYPSGKSQVDLVDEILAAFKDSDVVFLKGVVGSGKSVVGMRVALEMGKGAVSVPTKVLSDQYVRSYERNLYFKHPSKGYPAGIGLLKGRQNYRCPHTLGHRSCASSRLPCTRLLEKGESRVSSLAKCPYWGFIFSDGSKANSELGPDIKTRMRVLSYQGVDGHNWNIYLNERCPYWEQFVSYFTSDIIVLNSAKWAAEVLIGRFPKVALTVVDEADYWLDSLAVKVVVSEERIASIKERLASEEKETRERTRRASEDVILIRELDRDWEAAVNGNARDLVETLVRVLGTLDETDSDFFWRLSAILENYEHVETRVEEGRITYCIPHPGLLLKKFMARVGGKWLLMSATCQSEDVLRDVFELKASFVEGRTEFPGKIMPRTTGLEQEVTYAAWANPTFKERYWECLSRITSSAAKPAFAPVHALKYLPPETRSSFEANRASDFNEVNGVIYSTKMDRGVDLQEYRSVVLLKFPFPDASDPLLKGMLRRFGPGHFWKYYRDIASRDFVQQVGRVVRSDDDEIEFWSPDARCHAELPRLWKGNIDGN